MSLIIRDALKEDAALVLEFIKGIAAYEKLLDEVEATVENIEHSIFDNKDAHVVFAYEGQVPVAFALFFYNYSTFKGRKGLYLEDLFVKEAYRGKGIGHKVFDYLKAKAKEEACGRMEWVCLNWNQKAIDFYLEKGAKPLGEWTTFRLDESQL